MMEEKALTIVEVTNDIENIVAKVTDTNLPEMQKAVNMAYGVQKLKKYFMENQELKKVITNLSGTTLGFRTDKQYNESIVVECCITALLSGYRLHGNEFNIIANNFYPAKAGKFRKIIETPGLANFREKIGIPEKKGNEAVVKVSASWNLNQINEQIEAEVVVKIYSSSDTDYIIGKAQSKLYSRVLTRLTGTFIPDADLDIEDKKKPVQPELKKIDPK